MSSRGDNTSIFGFLDSNRSLGYQASVSWMHRFSMRTFGTLAYSFSRQSATSLPFFANRFNVAAAAGITGTINRRSSGDRRSFSSPAASPA